MLIRLFIGFLIFSALASENPSNPINIACFSSNANTLAASLKPCMTEPAVAAGLQAAFSNSDVQDNSAYEHFAARAVYFDVPETGINEASSLYSPATLNLLGDRRDLLRAASDNSPPECA